MSRRIALVVDDEALVRQLVKTVLRSAGYDVVEAENGLEGLSLVRVLTAKTPLDVVVSDVRMPQLDGIQLAEAVRAEFPTLPVLLMSGYSDAMLDARFEVLSKPFRREALLAAVSKAVSKSSGAGS